MGEAGEWHDLTGFYEIGQAVVWRIDCGSKVQQKTSWLGSEFPVSSARAGEVRVVGVAGI